MAYKRMKKAREAASVGSRSLRSFDRAEASSKPGQVEPSGDD
jgi:hypothetical protein